jgi:hypothetical protein
MVAPAHARSRHREIDWSSAEVREGVLRVSELGLEPDADDAQAAQDPQKAADQRLTERFRAFAPTAA